MKERVIEYLGNPMYWNILVALLIILGTLMVGKLFSRFFQRTFMEEVLASKDPTNYRFFAHIIRAIIYIAGFGVALYTIPPLRTLSTSILAGAGILAVAIGFASQAALSNIIGGLFIVVFKPFRVNDRISIDMQINGVVEDITLRHTVVRDYEHRRIIIPNSIVSEKVIVNSDLVDESLRKFLYFTIAHHASVTEAMAIIERITAAHPLCMDVRTPEEIAEGEPKVVVRVTRIAPHGVELRAVAPCAHAAHAFELSTDVNLAIKAAFDKAGIAFATWPEGLMK